VIATSTIVQITSPISLLGSELCFDRGGRRLIAVEPDALIVVEAGRQTTRLAYRNVRAVAGFDDQLWIATDDELVRVDPTGHPIGNALPIAFASGATLVPAPCGPAAAVWTATPPIALVDDFGTLVRVDLLDTNLAVPVSGRKHIACRGSKVTFPSGIVSQLPPNASVVAGVVMADGKTMILLVATESRRQLVTGSLTGGQIVRLGGRFDDLSGKAVRVAIKGRLAIVQLAPRELLAIDLRTGRELGAVAFEHDVVDHAIDPEARSVAIRLDDGSIDVDELAALLRGPTESIEVTAPVEVAVEPVELARSPPLLPVRGPFVCPPLAALDPRTRPKPIERAIARSQLDRELRSVSLWTLAAIATSWDTRRLGYGNEGRHPHELEVAALLGMGAGFAPEYIASARDAVADHELELAADPSWRAPGTPIGELMTELDLDHRAVDVLLVIAAASLRGEVARLYGILANDQGRPLVDDMLVQHVLATRHDRHDIAEELDPRASLVRLGVVHVSTRRARPFAELTVDPVILDRLRAIPIALGAATALEVSTRELATLDISQDVLDAAVAALARAGSEPVRVAVSGRTGSGRRTLVAALAAQAGRDVAIIDATLVARTSDAFVVELRRALRRSHLAGLVPCIVNLTDATFDDRAGHELAAEPLRNHPGPVAVIATPDATIPFAPGYVSIQLAILPETERRQVWTRAFVEAGARVADVDVLAARYKIGPGLIRNAVAHAAGTDAIESYIRQTRDARLARYARRVDRLATWSSVVLPPDVLDSLRELVARVRHGHTVFETWGMNRTMATSRGLTALFGGQPGTGKTLVAGVIARELGLDLYQVDLSKVISKWIGETERNLSTIFDAAEDGQVILLFDEADSLFAKRTEVRSSNDRYANLEVNYLLQRLDAFEGIAILTTNSSGSIDPAFKRRLSFRLSFPFPDDDTREQLWRAHLPPELPIRGPLALDVLARKYQLSGGYIRNACLRAAFLAAQEETALHQRHLERAVALEFAELGKLSSGGSLD